MSSYNDFLLLGPHDTIIELLYVTSYVIMTYTLLTRNLTRLKSENIFSLPFMHIISLGNVVKHV